MCEILAIKWPAPRSFSEIRPQARAMEHYGQANFGWGVAWLEAGRVRRYRSVGRLGDDAADAEFLKDVVSTHFVVHFRRPSRLSTIQLADTQPFVDDEHSVAFAHNGRFTEELEYRFAYAGRLTGAADSEVGFLMFLDLLRAGVPSVESMQIVHSKLGGKANLVSLDAAGEVAIFSEYDGNRFWMFRLGDASVAATELHSPDGSLFDLIFAGASERQVVEGGGRL
jgi:predicted glutamine amidotransferase